MGFAQFGVSEKLANPLKSLKPHRVPMVFTHLGYQKNIEPFNYLQTHRFPKGFVHFGVPEKHVIF